MLSPFTSATAALNVTDIGEAVSWYTRLLGRGPDIEPVPGVAEWELLAGTWLQLAENAELSGPGSQVLRLGVPDVTAAHDALRSAGIDVDEIEVVPDVISYVDFRDPDGNVLSLYQVLS